jgi:hypothetical protein
MGRPPVIGVLASLVVAIACVVTSARRLASAVAPTSFDAELLRAALPDAASVAVLRARLEARSDTSWERDLLDALAEPFADARDALVDTQVLELGWLVGRWARVPRVCASISASTGGFFGALAIIVAQGPVGEALTPALDSFAIGVLGAALCATVLVRSRAAGKAHAAASERLVAHLRALTA